jgi:hypothetical protein
VKRILTPVMYALATAYFLVDVIFMAIARPVANWCANHAVFVQLRKWIASLRPYPALALLAVPFILLEPIKPIAAYLAATSHVRTALIIIIIGELLKLVVVERLFCITRDKLMLIPKFAWAYAKFRRVKDWLEATDAWRTVRRLGKLAVHTARSHFAAFRSSRTARRISWQ